MSEKKAHNKKEKLKKYTQNTRRRHSRETKHGISSFRS